MEAVARGVNKVNDLNNEKNKEGVNNAFKHHKNNNRIRFWVASIGLILLLNFKYEFSFMSSFSIISIVILVILKILLKDHFAIKAWGIVTGISFIVPVFLNASCFNEKFIPIIVDSLIGLTFIVYSSFKLIKKKK